MAPSRAWSRIVFLSMLVTFNPRCRDNDVSPFQPGFLSARLCENCDCSRCCVAVCLSAGHALGSIFLIPLMNILRSGAFCYRVTRLSQELEFIEVPRFPSLASPWHSVVFQIVRDGQGCFCDATEVWMTPPGQKRRNDR